MPTKEQWRLEDYIPKLSLSIQEDLLFILFNMRFEDIRLKTHNKQPH